MKKILSVLIALLLAAFCVFPAMAEDSDDPVIFTENSYYCVGYNMTVDIESMTDYDARVWNAFIEGGVQYAWYLDYEFYSSSQDLPRRTKTLPQGHTIYNMPTTALSHEDSTVSS